MGRKPTGQPVGRPPNPQIPEHELRLKTVEDVHVALNIRQATYYNLAKLPGFPRTGTPREKYDYLKAKQHGTQIGAGEDDGRDWRQEGAKWSALKNKQKVEQERLAIILAAREAVLDGIEEILIGTRKRLSAEFRDHPELVERLNKILDESRAALAKK